MYRNWAMMLALTEEQAKPLTPVLEETWDFVKNLMSVLDAFDKRYHKINNHKEKLLDMIWERHEEFTVEDVMFFAHSLPVVYSGFEMACEFWRTTPKQIEKELVESVCLHKYGSLPY